MRPRTTQAGAGGERVIAALLITASRRNTPSARATAPAMDTLAGYSPSPASCRNASIRSGCSPCNRHRRPQTPRGGHRKLPHQNARRLLPALDLRRNSVSSSASARASSAPAENLRSPAESPHAETSQPPATPRPWPPARAPPSARAASRAAYPPAPRPVLPCIRTAG